MKVFDFENGDDFWSPIGEFLSLRLDHLRQNNEQRLDQTVKTARYKSKIDELLKGKKESELAQLEAEIESYFASNQFTMDHDYWDFAFMAVKERRAVLRFRRFLDAVKDIEFKKPLSSIEEPIAHERDPQDLLIDVGFEEDCTADCMSEEQFKKRVMESKKTGLERTLLERVDRVAKEENAVLNKIVEARHAAMEVVSQIFNKTDTETVPADVEQDMTETIISLAESREWAAKYHPRKPHYFNRVKLGYEWSKINQIRYTKDNPPPREVIGYKFNIFYPEMADRSSVPKFKLVQMPDPTCITICFLAPPPYEKISFQIVNQQWDMANRKNFKCIFDKNVLHLYFDFVKQRHLR